MSFIDTTGYEAAMQKVTGNSLQKKIDTYREKEKKQAETLDAARIAAADPSKKSTKLREVAEDLVSIFMGQIMKSMRATVKENDLMHGGNGEEFFRDMQDQEYAKLAAKGKGYGLTGLVYQALANKSGIKITQPEKSKEAAISMENLTGSGDSQ